MKKVLISLLCLVALLFTLSACNSTGDTPATTTEPSENNPTATEPTVTEQPTLSANYIKEATTMSTGEIQITYNDASTLNLGSLPLREGYNSAKVEYTLDTLSGELLVSISDSADVNIANQQIGTAKAPTVVVMREQNGTLEWKMMGESVWQTLCSADGTDLGEGVSPLIKLAEILKIGKTGEVTGDGVILVVKDHSLLFRAREWKDGTDLVMDADYGVSVNKIFNINSLGEIASKTSINATSGATKYKGAVDDIAAILINGTNIGANHGYYVVAAIPDTKKVMTEADIGSIWQGSDGTQYVLVRINPTASANTLWFCPYYKSAMDTGVFAYKAIAANSTLTHVSGATHTDSISVTAASKQEQLRVAVNHRKGTVFLNGNVEIDITKSKFAKSYKAEFVDFYDEYDVIYLPDMLNYLIANVGNNTEMSHCDEAIEGAYFTYRATYRYHKNGACVAYVSYDFHKNVEVGMCVGIMSGPFAEKEHYVYVPGSTNLSTPTLQIGKSEGGTKNTFVGTDTLANPDVLVSSYFQLTDANGTKAMNVGFNTQFGTAVDSVRRQYLSNRGQENLGNYNNSSYKMYPALISKASFKAGASISYIAYRIPSYIMDSDFVAINWYWVGEDIYLSLHTSKAVDKTVTVLPEYMNGMKISIIESSASFSVLSDTVENGSVGVKTTSEGYAILKLSPVK